MGAAKLLLMGDFNDEPANKSIQTVLKARGFVEPAKQSGLYNCFFQLDEQKHGSYNFRGIWNMLDQVIVSGSLLNEKAGLWVLDAQIFKKDGCYSRIKKTGRNDPNEPSAAETIMVDTATIYPFLLNSKESESQNLLTCRAFLK